MTSTVQPDRPLRIGVSSCLIGEPVRFDGNHKRDDFVADVLGPHADFVPICPEVGIGLGVPRPTIRLVVSDGGAVRARGVNDPELDVTAPLVKYLDQVVDQVRQLDGYILKRGSPSCGMQGVKHYRQPGHPPARGSGLYAEALLARFPQLPVEDEGRLNDARLRENFITRVFTYHRWRQMVSRGVSAGALVQFHAQHKYLLLAHNQAAYRRLGPVVAAAGQRDPEALAQAYIAELMSGLSKVATPRSHSNVLEHMAGFLKRALDLEDKAELHRLIAEYREGRVPLVVPLTLMKHHFRRHPHPVIANQVYLDPHPAELMLRNHV
ncbi:MAG: DUF523 and DUF1722 domain-containing protein [Pseudomonadota bacterium]|nr:DUF523 and DUF1722 domain-containing protein [Pseudomonadota bacterium]